MPAGRFTPTAGAATNPQALNAAKQAGLQAAVKLGPGESLGFRPGKGYYAKADPPPVTAAPPAGNPNADPTTGATFAPTQTPQQIYNDASKTATGEINSQIQPVAQSGAAADAVAKAQMLESAGFSSAASRLLGTIAPQVQGAFNGAADETGQLAKGFTSSLQGDINQEQAAGAQQALDHGGTTPWQVDPTAFGNVQYMKNGFIPGTLLAQQGAAAAQQARGSEVVQQDVGRADLQNQQADQQAADAKTASEIATIAAKYPELFTAQEHQDIAANLKAVGINAGISEKGASLNASISEHAATVNEQATRDYNTAMHQNAQDTIALRKQGFSERVAAAKMTLSYKTLNARIQYDNGRLKISGTSAAASFLRAQTAAHGLDASASKVAGHLVMQNGQPVLTKSGKFVGVDPKVYSSSKVAPPTGPKSIYGQMVKLAASDRKSAVSAAEKVPAGSLAPGTYVLAPGLAVDPDTDFAASAAGAAIPFPATTTDRTRAATSSTTTLADKVTQYVNQFGVTPKEARRALIAGGWKATGRPKRLGPPPTIRLAPSPFPPPVVTIGG